MKAIVCMTNDRSIGRDGDLLVKIKDDLRRFRKLTDGKTVVMGRKTWESLPENNRPLKNRRNIVLTSAGRIDGAETAGSVDEILKMTDGENAYVIGGGSVYEQLLPYVDEVDITYVGISGRDTDVKFPVLNPAEWCVCDTSELLKEGDIPYKFARAVRWSTL